MSDRSIIERLEEATQNFIESVKVAQTEPTDSEAAKTGALYARLWFAQMVDITLTDKFAVLLEQLKGREAPESSLYEQPRGDTALAAGEADSDGGEESHGSAPRLSIVRDGEDGTATASPSVRAVLNQWNVTGEVPDGD